MIDRPTAYDTPDAPGSQAIGTANGQTRRQWQQPLGEIHSRLGNMVGAGSLAFSFDCDDQNFVFALTSRWPVIHDFTHSMYETDTLKLADALNGLVRLYAIETEQQRLHVLLEARRGKPELPGWWSGAAGQAPLLFATYAFDTNFAQVGLFSDLADAYADMEMISHPHRLLVAIGPASPQLVDADGTEVEVDADEERLASLKRWNQRLSLQINRLLAETFGGNEEEMEAVVKALSKVRDLSTRLTRQLGEGRPPRRGLKKAAGEDFYGARPRTGKRAALDAPAPGGAGKPAESLGETLADLQTALKSDGFASAVTPAMRADLQKSLDILIEPPALAPEPVSSPARRPMPAVAKSVAKQGPSTAMIVLFGCLLASAAAASDGHRKFGLQPYRDTMAYYEYAPTRDARLSSGGNGRATPPAPVALADATGNASSPCADGKRTGQASVGDKPYRYRCDAAGAITLAPAE